MTGETYAEILEEVLIPLKETFLTKKLIFQQDDARPLIFSVAQSLLRKSEMELVKRRLNHQT